MHVFMVPALYLFDQILNAKLNAEEAGSIAGENSINEAVWDYSAVYCDRSRKIHGYKLRFSELAAQYCTAQRSGLPVK